MFGNNSHGFLNERDISGYIDKIGNFDEMNNNIKSFLNFLFHRDLKGSYVSSKSIRRKFKPDIVIEIGDEKRYVSIKSGSGNSVHQEKLSVFESFLSSCSVSNKTIDYLKEFHYADGTIDGSGSKRFNLRDWIKFDGNEFKVQSINSDLNKKNILSKLIDRFLFVGNLEEPIVADALYHGDVVNGAWASRYEIMNHLTSNSSQLSSSTVHFGNLRYQIWNRNLKFNPDTEDRRQTMQIKWPSVKNDILDIRNSADFSRGTQDV